MQVHDLIAEAYQNGHVYHGFINALIGAGASILGGLFGRKKAKPQVQETITDQTSTSSSSVDFAKMSADAQAAGFNPLTAIRSGAIGGYVTSSTRTQGKNVTTTTGGGGGEPNAFGVIADGIGQMAAGGLFGSFNTPKNDPIKVRNKSTGEIRSVVGAQLGSTRRAGSVVVAPRQTTVRSPTTSRPATKGLVGPPSPKQWSDANGGMDLYIPYYDRSTNKVLWGPNPDIPDLDQMLTPPAIAVPNKIAETAAPITRWTLPNNKGRDRTYRVNKPHSRGNAAF